LLAIAELQAVWLAKSMDLMLALAYIVALDLQGSSCPQGTFAAYWFDIP